MCQKPKPNKTPPNLCGKGGILSSASEVSKCLLPTKHLPGKGDQAEGLSVLICKGQVRLNQVNDEAFV